MTAEDKSSECTGELTPATQEGPFYKCGSPERNYTVGPDTPGTYLVLEGSVFDRDCRPVAGAWIDFWHADGNGQYDNEGYNLRGHQHTDDKGRFCLETVIPALYGNRTPHIHVKVQANPQSKIYTTQLYFPGIESNEKDPLFEPANVIDVTETAGVAEAKFDLVVEVT